MVLYTMSSLNNDKYSFDFERGVPDKQSPTQAPF